MLIAAFAVGILSSCQSTGFSCDAVGPALTPDVDATTTERTWKKEPGKNREVPVETEVENPPAYRWFWVGQKLPRIIIFFGGGVVSRIAIFSANADKFEHKP